jgi:hypothetical protein
MSASLSLRNSRGSGIPPRRWRKAIAHLYVVPPSLPSRHAGQARTA